MTAISKKADRRPSPMQKTLGKICVMAMILISLLATMIVFQSSRDAINATEHRLLSSSNQ